MAAHSALSLQIEWLNSGPQLRQEDISGYEDVRTGVFIQNIPRSHNVTIVDIGNLGGDLRLSSKSKKENPIWGVELNARTMYIHKAKQLEVLKHFIIDYYNVLTI
jgi:hypothetical protein